MLSEARQQKILQYIAKRKIVTVEELKTFLKASESTVRRDLLALDAAGKVVKVHGGAMEKPTQEAVKDTRRQERQQQYKTSKQRIGQAAASCVQENDVIYIDAGTTTEYMISYLHQKEVTFVTNGIKQAQQLSQKGYEVILLGGEIKAMTEAIVGTYALQMLQSYNFTKGFFGANGVTVKQGYTTPKNDEATIKRAAMQRCRESYIVVDGSKIGQVAAITFGDIEEATIITDTNPEIALQEKTKIWEVHT